ncbi:hypothetical protein Sulac_1216 [Sulfobacillus acidophilus DSM 10332]|uniref:Uncharacterized protein n=1 Tax=Sulfobacillus acidophilus (strain ATCC 700253 / DSM 10332 / NAL) TaxID=679936 RepID=G8TV76_SULAD|nr:hypothetical protein Sulac_1216 [Sulfobacillus acidophilus DSM 10332]
MMRGPFNATPSNPDRLVWVKIHDRTAQHPDILVPVPLRIDAEGPQAVDAYLRKSGRYHPDTETWSFWPFSVEGDDA